MTRYHAHRRVRPLVYALRVLGEGAVFLFALGSLALVAWLATS